MLKILLGTVTLFALLLDSALSVSAADSPPRIMVNEVMSKLDSGQTITFIDTRNGSAWSGSNKIIPGAIRVRGGQDFADVMMTLTKDSFIVTYCT